MSNFPNAAAATATRQELQRLFTPAISLMNRLKYPYKFALITLLFLLPLTLTMSLFVINLNRQIEFSRREIIGTQYLRTLWPPLVHATQSHSRRTDSSEVQATQHPLPEVTEQILKELTTVGTLHRQRGLNHEVTSAVRKLQESQKSLVETAMSKNPTERVKIHHDIRINIKELIEVVGDQSNLILDPDLDSYYLMDAVVLNLPRQMEIEGELRVWLSQNDGQPMSDGIRLDLRRFSTLLHRINVVTERGLRRAIKNNLAGNLAPALTAPLEDHLSAMQALLEFVDQQIAIAASEQADWADFDYRLERLNTADIAFFERTLAELDRLLLARIAGIAMTRNLVAGLFVISLLIVSYVLFGFYFAMKNTVGQLRIAALQLTGETADHLITLTTRDELGEVATAFNLIAIKLHQQWRLALEKTSQIEVANLHLAASESFNLATLNALSAHIAVLDAEGNIVSANQAWTDFSETTGASCLMGSEGANYLATCDCAAEKGDPDAAAVAQAIREVIAGELESWCHEYSCHSPNEQRWFYCRVTRCDVDGRPRIVMAHENINAMKEAQKLVEISERRFVDLFEFSPDAIVIANGDGIIVQANQQVATVFGWEPSELVGQPVEVLVTTDLRADHPNLRERFLQSTSPSAMGCGRDDLLGLRKDGGVFPVDISRSRIGLMVAFVVRDVTERKHAQDVLQEGIARKTAVLESSLDAIVTVDHTGAIVEFNSAAERMLGHTPAEAIGSQLVDLIIPPALREAHRVGFARYLATEKASILGQRLELPVLRADGSEFPAEVSIVRVLTPGLPLFTGFIRDITERTQLVQRVAERTAELIAAEQASHFKSEFLSTMSHELRTPLNGILGMNELLQRTELTARQREFVEAGTLSGQILLQLINDILDLSKIEAGKLELNPRECSLEGLAYDVITFFSHAAKQKGLMLTCDVDPQVCVTAECDDHRLRQILVNLLGNAFKFTASGSVTLRAKCRPADDSRTIVRFSVTDTGAGIPQTKVNRLFSPFSQVDSSTARQFGGTGLGLSISKQLVELMGGTIGVESQLGVGSTFWFEIPLQFIAGDANVARMRQILAGARVLAVDGIDRDRRQIGECLLAWGCPTEQVATLREALTAVVRAENARTSFNVVLVDCKLTVGDEYVLLQKLAANPSLPVIGLGTDEDDEAASRLHQLGVRHLLRDPVRPSVLFDALTSVLAVSVPSLTADKQKPTADREPSSPPISGHILVAEDNRINQMFIIELLKHFGCTCDIANNGDEVLTALQLSQYDLILMDCQMPEMDGFTAAREIRRREAADGESHHIPIIALTANALKGDRERCLESGMDDYLSKPLQGIQLQTLLEKYLGQANQRKPASDGNE